MESVTRKDLVKRLRIMYAVTGVSVLINFVLLFYGMINQTETEKRAAELELCKQNVERQRIIAEINMMEAQKQLQRAEAAVAAIKAKK